MRKRFSIFDFRCFIFNAVCALYGKNAPKLRIAHFLIISLLFTFYFLLFTLPVQAQNTRAEADSARATPVAGITSDTVGKKKGEGFSRHQRAALYSAILPGLGQAYNRQYWKLPIVYGAAATLTFFLVNNNNSYQAYRSEVIYRLDNPGKIEGRRFANLSDLQVLRLRDRYRRDRDFTIIISGLVYLLQIADAHVFSHLLEYNVSDDLSLRTQPVIHPGGAIGLSLNLSLR